MRSLRATQLSKPTVTGLSVTLAAGSETRAAPSGTASRISRVQRSAVVDSTATDVRFEVCRFAGCIFSDADLSNSVFDGCDFTDTVLEHGDVTGLAIS